MPKTYDISIVTAHRNDSENLTRLRDSLVVQSWPEDRYEWIIIDDASTKPLPEWVTKPESLPFRLHFIQAPTHEGRARVRNRGIEAAKSDIIGFLDADTQANRLWIETLVRGVRESGGVIVGRLIPHPDMNLTAYLKYYHTRGAAKHNFGERVPGKYFTTCTSAVPRSLLERTGGFNADISSWGGEDLELGIRFEKAGAALHYDPRAWVLHSHDITWLKAEGRYREYGKMTVPKLISLHPEIKDLLTLSILDRQEGVKKEARRAVVRALLNPYLYQLVKWCYIKAPTLPWPDLVFDYMVFYLYSQPYLAGFEGTREQENGR